MKSDQSVDLYNDHILSHFDEPYHKGNLKGATHQLSLRNPVCGDEILLQLIIKDEKIQQTCFQAEGCIISQAAASILCQHIEGAQIDEMRNMNPQDMLDLLKVPLTATRQQCGLLPFKTLKQILYSMCTATSDWRMPKLLVPALSNEVMWYTS